MRTDGPHVSRGTWLFPDAEGREDPVEHVVGRHQSHDALEGGNRRSQVYGGDHSFHPACMIGREGLQFIERPGERGPVSLAD